MSRTVVTSKVGADGVLHLTVPLTPADAGRDVQVTVESLPAHKQMTNAEWLEMMKSLGPWEGEFERPPQGDYEVREPL